MGPALARRGPLRRIARLRQRQAAPQRLAVSRLRDSAFNEDKPYARFVASNWRATCLYPDDPEATVATGFIAAGPWDFVGHVELREGTTDKKITRAARSRRYGARRRCPTFVSLTAHCARCHDHKFDPIRQEDYYSLQAVFAGVDRADRPFDRDPKVIRAANALLVKTTRRWQRR